MFLHSVPYLTHTLKKSECNYNGKYSIKHRYKVYLWPMINSTVEDTTIWASKFNHSYQSTVEYLADLADTNNETLQRSLISIRESFFRLKFSDKIQKKLLC